MRRVALMLVVLVSAAGPCWADPPPNTLTEAEQRAGWRLLFDGRTTTGFRTYRQPVVGPGWTVVDGALVRSGQGAGDLVTAEEFAAFELQLDYRIPPGGNSGVMFHVTEDAAAPWQSGPEVQILDNAQGRDPQLAGWLYQLYQPVNAPWARKMEQAAGLSPPELVDATRPAGAWNQLRLFVSPAGCEVFLNGVPYERFTIGSDDWNERVAASKFAAFPGFAKAGRGRICLQDHGDAVAFRSIKVRPLPADPAAAWKVDGTLAVAAVPAFPGIRWEGWSPEDADGKPAAPLRPLLVTHAGDGSGRLFVPDQSGMIHVIRPGAKQARLFLDLRAGTAPWTTWNEEGLLGLAFHPRFRETGEFFVCQSVKGAKRLQHVTRFRVSGDDPDRGDPSSAEVVLEVEQPFWNHNGGSIAFGPDGFLYVGLGDGGSRNDPLGHGQRLDTLFGKILRLDVDHRHGDRGYAIPADNPFVGRAGTRPEIYAFGFRNPWQLAFDPPTKRLWAADVGQDLWEEVDLVVAGGNYGWSVKEGSKAFGSQAAAGPLVEPVWEYDHQVGKSVTGGSVYRGTAIPELVGRYVYGDFVSGRMWALSVDDAGRPTANHSIPWGGLPIFGFGTDADGEIYACTSSPTGQGVFKLVSTAAAVEPAAAETPSDPLPSWNEGPVKRAIVDFVRRVSDPASPDHVPQAERVAVFDNDGTLWPEEPLPFQAAFAIDRLRARVAAEPALADDPMVRALLAGDLATLMKGDGHEGLLHVVALTHAGLTVEEFGLAVEEWLAAARHPRFGRRYDQLTYQPMQEVLVLLRDHGFKPWIVSGGGVDFMRVWTERVHGIAPEQVIGTTGRPRFELRPDGPALVKTLEHLFVNDAKGKPVGIQQFIGRRPIACFGNSDGDLAMLQYTTVANPRPALGVIVHHTDADREYAYDAHPSVSGRLVDALAEAPARGWLVVDMAKDWACVFAAPERHAAVAGFPSCRQNVGPAEEPPCTTCRSTMTTAPPRPAAAPSGMPPEPGTPSPRRPATGGRPIRS